MPIPNKHERIENTYVSWICNDFVTLFAQRLASPIRFRFVAMANKYRFCRCQLAAVDTLRRMRTAGLGDPARKAAESFGDRIR